MAEKAPLGSKRYLIGWFILLGSLLLSGCDVAPPAAPKFLQAPRLEIADAAAAVPLSTVIAFETDQAVIASYRVSDGQRSWQAHSRRGSAQTPDAYRSAHHEVLLKFTPDTLHHLYVRITNARGQATEFAKPLLFRTPPLPETFPSIQAVQQTAERAVTGAVTEGLANNPAQDSPARSLNLISVINRPPEDAESADQAGQTGWLIALDEQAAVVWFMAIDAPWRTIEPLDSGNLRLYDHAGSILEVDMLGNKIAAWQGENQPGAQAYFKRHGLRPTILPVEGQHHRAIHLADGQRLSLSHEVQWHSQRTAADRDIARGESRQPLQGDLVTEFDRLGQPLQQWRLLEILDPHHQGRHSADNPRRMRPAATEKKSPIDWSHASGLAYWAETDSLIVSLRHQQAVVAIERSSGALQWLLCDPSNWKDSPLYQQHSDKWLKPAADSQSDGGQWPESPGQPYLSAEGELLFVDRREPGEAQLVVYSIETASKTFKQRTHHRLAADLPARLSYSEREQRVALSYRQPSEEQPEQQISRLLQLSVAELLNAPQQRAAPQQLLQLSGGLIHDHRWVAHLIPPAPAAAREAQPLIDASSLQAVEPQSEMQSEVQSEAWRDTAVTEGDWRIVVESSAGRSEQLLKIDRQQGPIALGYLGDYPVMVVVKGRSLRFTTRSSGALGRASWYYRGLVDASGLEAQGTFSVRNEQGDTVTAGIPWHAYRQ